MSIYQNFYQNFKNKKKPAQNDHRAADEEETDEQRHVRIKKHFITKKDGYS